MRADPSKNIPLRTSESQVWIQWHKDLKGYFQKNLANSIWIYGWGKRGGVGAKGNTSTLRNYMQSQGVDIDKTTLQSIGDSVDDVFDSISRVFGGIGIGVLVLSGVLILIVLRIIWKLGEDPNKGIKDALAIYSSTKMIK